MFLLEVCNGLKIKDVNLVFHLLFFKVFVYYNHITCRYMVLSSTIFVNHYIITGHSN